ncbi:hypothetical protein HRbin22_02243 [Candidatus Thermoflexus japonica]|uniref:Uncharacterized protein n=1 Tax=Candidatus Thermoflexus japonica TaxID=2035417 RepID=A0A2H5Y982_9CHLR|nr:hypothetical protein HRbin22_02243 [Candidatus Thermoflexus japonica]
MALQEHAAPQELLHRFAEQRPVHLIVSDPEDAASGAQGLGDASAFPIEQIKLVVPQDQPPEAAGGKAGQTHRMQRLDGLIQPVQLALRLLLQRGGLRQRGVLLRGPRQVPGGLPVASGLPGGLRLGGLLGLRLGPGQQAVGDQEVPLMDVNPEGDQRDRPGQHQRQGAHPSRRGWQRDGGSPPSGHTERRPSRPREPKPAWREERPEGPAGGSRRRRGGRNRGDRLRRGRCRLPQGKGRPGGLEGQDEEGHRVGDGASHLDLYRVDDQGEILDAGQSDQGGVIQERAGFRIGHDQPVLRSQSDHPVVQGDGPRGAQRRRALSFRRDHLNPFPGDIGGPGRPGLEQEDRVLAHREQGEAHLPSFPGGRVAVLFQDPVVEGEEGFPEGGGQAAGVAVEGGPQQAGRLLQGKRLRIAAHGQDSIERLRPPAPLGG